MKKIRMVFSVFVMLLLILGTTPVIGSEIHRVSPNGDREIRGLSYVGHLDTPGNANEIVVQGDYAYIADWYSLRIIDISTPSAPVEVGSYPASVAIRAIAVEGDYVYFAESWSLKILDVSTPSTPTLVEQVSMKIPEGIDVEGNFAYIVEWDWYTPNLYRLVVVDVTDKVLPSKMDSLSYYVPTYDVDVVGSYAYIAAEEQGLRVVDITDPSNVSEVGFYDSPNYSRGVTVVGNLTYLGENNGLRIVDISTPTAPSLVSAYGTPGYNVEDCVVAWGNAFLANHHAGVVMLDVTNPSAPSLVDVYDTAGEAYDVAEANGLIYVADNTNGLVILQPTFRVTGVVNDRFGGTISGVTMTATDGYTTLTNATGAYSIDDMPPGTYTLTPSKKPYVFTPSSCQVTLPPNANEINFFGEIKNFIPLVLKD